MTAYYWDAASLGHDTGGFVEGIPRAERLRPARLAERVPGLDHRPVRPHGAEEWVLRVHERGHLERVRRVCARGPGLRTIRTPWWAAPAASPPPSPRWTPP